MQKKNLIRLFMFQIVFGYATKNQLITNLIKAFKNGIIQLGSIIDQLVSLGSNADSIDGSGAQKEYFRSLLDHTTYNIIKAARGYFISIKQFDTAAKLNFSLSRISKISDKNIAMRAAYWYSLINPVIANMADWNLSPETMQAWQSAIDNYKTVSSLPKDETESRKDKNAQEDALIKQGMNFCRDILDSAAIGYKTNDNLEFYNKYISYRRLTPVASKHGKFRVLITDELHVPIVNVLISQDKVTNTVKTDIDGLASLDIIYNEPVIDPNKKSNDKASNLYSFTLSLGTNSISTGLIEIKHNETVSRVYIMAPSGFIIPSYEPKAIPVTA